MNTYLLVHRQPPNYRGGPDKSAAWDAWFEALGDALIDRGNPVLGDRSAAGEADTESPLGGYTIITAESIDEAARLARGCPLLHDAGAVEIGRLTPVPGRKHPARTF